MLMLASGCFYIDPINQRPSADIIQRTSGTLYRGDDLVLDASTYDPEGQTVEVVWRAYACTDATTPDGCDAAPFYTDVLTTVSILVPKLRADKVTPVSALRVILEAHDSDGAVAKPSQELLVAVEDKPPDLTPSASPREGNVRGTAIDLYVKVGDQDDGAAAVKPLDWQVFGPASQPAYTLVDKGALPQDPTQFWKVFTPMGTGDWDIQITATDPLGAQTVAHLPITVVDDHAPCLAQWAPLAPPAGSTLPMQDPTLFEVLVVQDDLDPYPAVPTDPVKGTTEFSWSILPPGATTRQPLAIDGNSVALDPASYKPGDVLELRVEIQDRNHTAIPCADSVDVCSVISDTTCNQRLTWHVEVR
jgi:hypothetical protein